MRTIIRNNYTPKAGDYHERIIIDNSRHKTWLFDCDGIWTDITRIYLAEEFGDSSDIGLSQKFITEQFKVTDEKIEGVREEVGDLSERVDGVEENLNIEIENRIAADEDLQENIDKVAEDLEEFKNSPDVVDIVNTKADLDAYDTSKLGENDIVRVLVDETQDGASTYYKWTGSTWNYIGKTGPYYTKVEADNLLDEKADKSDLDNYYSKTETDSLLNDKADKATTYTKTEVDNLIPDITPLATKQEVADGLATKQNTLTAGENITIENDVISATGGTKSVELTQAEYDALTPEQQMDGTVYYITDGQGGGSAKLYPEQGYNTDGAMTQKAATDMIFPEDYPGVISIGTGQPQPGVTSGLMIGGSGIGENSVAILSSMEGHEGSVAILSDACYGNNSVAIAGTTDNDNTFSIGSDYDPTDSKNKRLTGLRNGVMIHDAATVGQLNAKQDALIAGEGISIASDGKTISATSKAGVNFAVGQETWYGTYTDENGVVYQVYTKTIFIPALPATAGITTYPIGVSNMKQIIDIFGTTTDGFKLNAPRQTVSDNISIYQVSKGSQTFSIEVGKDRSSKSAYVTIIYAKNN